MKKKILKVGITGGIGSGKSTVAKIFETIGIPVYYTDDEAKRLINEEPSLKKSIIENFGEESYLEGVYNRKYIASIVFKDKVSLKKLDSIVHPILLADAEKWFDNQTTPYALKEAAILFESGLNLYLDKVIGVYAPQDLRISRVMLRNNITREKVIERINMQMNEEEKMLKCDYVIYNDFDSSPLESQVKKLDKLLKTLYIFE